MLNVGIIGAGSGKPEDKGKIGWYHLVAYNKLRKKYGIDQISFSRTNWEGVRATLEEFNKLEPTLSVRGYTDWVRMLNQEKLDILSICSPTKNHVEGLEEAIEKGIKRIFCEKPLCLYNQLNKVRELLEKAQLKGISIGVNVPVAAIDQELMKLSFNATPYSELKKLKYDIRWITDKKGSAKEALEDLWVYPYFIKKIEPKRLIMKSESKVEILASEGIVILGYGKRKERKWTFFNDQSYSFSLEDSNSDKIFVSYSLNGIKKESLSFQNPLEVQLDLLLRGKPLVSAEEAFEAVNALTPLE